MSDITKTPREELECKKKYLYDYSMFWECNDGSKCQILEDDVCDLLNEQQATIDDLKEDKAIAEDYANIFEKENVKLRKKLNEQQDIIFKLQDLCGKSDYENAQLRQKVKELQDKIDMLCEKYDYPKSGEK